MLKYPEDYESGETSTAKDMVLRTLDSEFYHGKFFQATEEGEMPHFIRLADKIVENLLSAGVHIPEGLESSHKIGA